MITIPNNQLEKIESLSSKVFIKEICSFIEDLQKTEINKNAALELIKQNVKSRIHTSSAYRVKIITTFADGYSEVKLT